VSAEDKKTVLEAVKEALEWVEENSEADADEFNDKRKEVSSSLLMW
jgi:molecular chaperone DnaK (HSP70)